MRREAWPNPIVTSLEPAGKFFVAEDYHQEYFANNGNQPYCQFVVAPKVKKFEQKFARKIKSLSATFSLDLVLPKWFVCIRWQPSFRSRPAS